MTSPERLVYILRHAKAADSDASDESRPLTADGREGAALVGRYLAQFQPAPERVLCSPSLRTRQTWEIVASETGWRPEVALPRSLYLASAGDLFGTIQQQPDGVGRILLVGHNPGMHDFCLKATDDPHHPLYQSLTLKFPPGSLAVFRCDIARWADAAPGRLRLLAFTKPSALA